MTLGVKQGVCHMLILFYVVELYMIILLLVEGGQRCVSNILLCSVGLVTVRLFNVVFVLSFLAAR